MKREDASEWAMVWLTIVIVVFGGITTWFTWKQIETSNKSAEAALRGVAVAESTWKSQERRDFLNARSQEIRDSLSNDAFKFQHRARLFPDLDNVTIQENKPILIEYVIKNFGNTPAYNVRHIIRPGADKLTLSDFVKLERETVKGERVIIAGHDSFHLRHRATDNVTRQQVEHLTKTGFGFAVVIVYETFSETHRTRANVVYRDNAFTWVFNDAN